MYIHTTIFLLWAWASMATATPRLRGNRRTYHPDVLAPPEPLTAQQLPEQEPIPDPPISYPESPIAQSHPNPVPIPPTPDSNPDPNPDPTPNIPHQYLLPTPVPRIHRYMLLPTPEPQQPTNQRLLPTPHPKTPHPIDTETLPSSPPSSPPQLPPFANNTEILPSECLFMSIPPTTVIPPCGKYQFITRDEL